MLILSPGRECTSISDRQSAESDYVPNKCLSPYLKYKTINRKCKNKRYLLREKITKAICLFPKFLGNDNSALRKRKQHVSDHNFLFNLYQCKISYKIRSPIMKTNRSIIINI